jgi:hypothetical protein
MKEPLLPPADSGETESDIRAVTELDTAWNQAYIRGERDSLRDILSADFIAVAPSGEEVPRSRLLQPPEEPATRVRFSEFALRCWGPTATTRGRILVETASQVIDQRYMRVYSKRQGRWWAVSVQVTLADKIEQYGLRTPPPPKPEPDDQA